MISGLTNSAILYGSNTYKFSINGSPHFPSSLTSPLIFGPFGNREELLPLLRNLRSIEIEFLLSDDDHWAAKRQRARLAYFVEILKQHSDDENRKSLLQELKINVCIPSPTAARFNIFGNPSSLPPADCETHMFGLESLATLRGIKDVEVKGVPDWFSQCMQLCVQGKGGEVQETDWPLVKVKRSASNSGWAKKKKTKQSWVSTRKWYQPTLNWKEFAERNNIELPEDVDKYWMVVD